MIITIIIGVIEIKLNKTQLPHQLKMETEQNSTSPLT